MLIEYRSGLISLLSLDARRAFTGPYSHDCRRHFSSAPRSHLLNTVVVPNQTADRARDRFGDPYSGGLLSTAHRGEQNATVDALPAGGLGSSYRGLGSSYRIVRAWSHAACRASD